MTKRQLKTMRPLLLSSYCILLLITCPIIVGGRQPVEGRHCHGSPKHVHIAVGAEPATQMQVTFASYKRLEARPTGGVLIGKDPNNLSRLVIEQEEALSYSTPLPRQTGMYHSPYYHHVLVDNLEPDTRYFYQVLVKANEPSLRGEAKKRAKEFAQEVMQVDEARDEEEEDDARRLAPPPYNPKEHGECPNQERIRSFRTAPVVGPNSVVKFAIVGDIGQFDHSQETMGHLRTHKKGVEAMMLTGDLAYPEFDERRWDTFLDFMDDYSYIDEIPMQITPGNHDVGKDEGGNKIFAAIEKRFRMPRVKPAELGLYEGDATSRMNMDRIDYPLPYEWGNAYYSFRYGPSHHIVLNSYSSIEKNSTQYKWLVEELESVDRDVTPWLFVMYHVPIYNTFNPHQRDPQRFAAIEHIEPLLVDYKVNMVFNGHVHAYLRTKNVAYNKVKKNGPIHIVVGAGGRAAKAEYLNEEPEEWVGVRDASWYGYGILEICNRTHIRWDWVHTGMESDHNEVARSNHTLPVGGVDHDFFENQYYMEEDDEFMDGNGAVDDDAVDDDDNV